MTTKMKQLSTQQSTALRLAAENTDAGMEGVYWYPRAEASLEGRTLSLNANTVGPALRALARKGLVEFIHPGKDYSVRATKSGKLVAAEEKGKPIDFIAPWDQQVLRERRTEAEAKGEDW